MTTVFQLKREVVTLINKHNVLKCIKITDRNSRRDSSTMPNVTCYTSYSTGLTGIRKSENNNYFITKSTAAI